MATHILWQNEQRTVTLIDVPRSIVEAQGFNSPDHYDILSSQARHTPYPSTEPKSTTAKAKLTDNSTDQILHAEYQELLTQALKDVRKNCEGMWCLPRTFIEEGRPPKKRKLSASEVATDVEQHDVAAVRDDLPHDLLSSLARTQSSDVSRRMRVEHSQKEDASRHGAHSNNRDARFSSNTGDEQATISVANDKDTATYRFTMPPRSSSYLGDCADSQDFRRAIRNHTRQQDTRSTFDFILLDPPWPNRSIKRTHKTVGTTYRTSPTLDDLGDMILDMQLENMMSDTALVGIWTTNKQAVRDLVLGLGGLFECWDVELVEEWIWLKTTGSGEPISELNALWRKPYEVLLLGRRQSKIALEGQPKQSVERRVIIGVPDLHSRKPCLKQLIEPLVPDPPDYTALEIFARHLVAGWCSWGDECLKFNWEGYWRHRDGSQ